MKTVCETLGVARSNIAARAAGSPSRAKGRPPLPDRELVEEIKRDIVEAEAEWRPILASRAIELEQRSWCVASC